MSNRNNTFTVITSVKAHGLSPAKICQIRQILRTEAAAFAFEQDVADSIRRDSEFNGLTGWHLCTATAALARHVARQLRKAGNVTGESQIKAYLWDNPEELNALPVSQMYVF